MVLGGMAFNSRRGMGRAKGTREGGYLIGTLVMLRAADKVYIGLVMESTAHYLSI
jgi:hypothetical protein